MLSATDLPTPAERRSATSAVSWRNDVLALAARMRGTLNNQAVDLIDLSLAQEPEPSHARAAIVAAYEGTDVLLQAAFDLIDAGLPRAVFSRCPPANPLGQGEPLGPPDPPSRLATRLARFSVEAAAVRIASAGDHVVNAHLRLAWEANAATRDDMLDCRFDPSRAEAKSWSTAQDLRIGLRASRLRAVTGVFDAFVLNDDFRRFYGTNAVRVARRYRDEIVHRARPSYQDAPAFGRKSRLAEVDRVTLSFPVKETEDPTLPTVDDRLRELAAAGEATLRYAEQTWEVAIRWLRTVGVYVRDRGDEVEIETTHELRGRTRFPRATRDPGPFLRA